VGQVLSVGAQLEPIYPSLMPRSASASGPAGDSRSATENGLPILVSLPENVSVLPGEIVDLRVLAP
jgi:hypothetical protein